MSSSISPGTQPSQSRKGLRIACVGEAMVELSFSDDGKRADVGFAGDTLNTAIYLRRALPNPAHVAFVSAAGVDALSDRLVAFIESEGVSTRQIARIPDRLPGIYAISRDAAGERSFAYWREASAARLLFNTGGSSEGTASFERLAGFDVIYYSAITLAIMPIATRSGFLDWLADYRRSGGRVSFDSNYRARLWESPDAARDFVARAWSATDIGLPTVDDEQALFGEHDEAETLARLRGYGLREGAMKRGAAGPVPISGPMPGGLCFPAARHVVDTTAAGDSFNGAFLSQYLTGGTLAEAMQSGHECALDVIAQRGAIIPRSALTALP